MFGRFHLTFACFQIEERGETEVSPGLVSESPVMEAEAGAAAGPGLRLGSGAAHARPSGHRDTGPVVSLTSGVSVSVGPSHSAELPSQQSQPIQFTVEFRRAMSSSPTSHTCPPCHMWV